MENPIKMDDLGGNTPSFGNTHMSADSLAKVDSLIISHYNGMGCE